MTAQRASRVSDLQTFVAEVIRTLQDRPDLDDPLNAVAWLGDVDATVAGDDASAKRRLACQLISLGLPTHVSGEHELVEVVARASARAIAEMNAIVDRLDSALVSFDERVVTPSELAEAAQTMHDALIEGNEGLLEAAASYLAGAVLADPRPYYAPGSELIAAIQAVEESLQYAQGLNLPADTPAEHLHGIVLCAHDIEAPDESSFVPDQDALIHHRWGRVAGHAAQLLSWEPLSDLDLRCSAETELERAVREAGFLLAASPMLRAPICFEHAQAARNVRTQAAELTTRWLDRALGYFDEDDADGVIRTPEDLHAQRGLLAQALIGTFCASA